MLLDRVQMRHSYRKQSLQPIRLRCLREGVQLRKTDLLQRPLYFHLGGLLQLWRMRNQVHGGNVMRPWCLSVPIEAMLDWHQVPEGCWNLRHGSKQLRCLWQAVPYDRGNLLLQWELH